MSLKERIQKDMREAARAKDSARLSTLRMLHSAVRQEEIDGRKDLHDTDILQVIGKMIKQREESAAMYESGGRPELAGKEIAETKMLAEYLPEQLSDDEVGGIIAECIEQAGAQAIKDMGKVMGEVKKRLAGRADMGAVSAKIRQLLQG
jgi:uncharacterized protein YqeY